MIPELLMIPIGLLLSAPNSSIVVLGQRYLPNHIALSAGVTMVFGGITPPVLCWIADQHGFSRQFWLWHFCRYAARLW